MNIRIYGDSIMKGAVLMPDGHYRAVMGEHIKAFEQAFGLQVVSRARFGSTVTRGLELLERDIEKGLDSQYALVEFGGNDCNFDWQAVAATPQEDHAPLTPPDQFEAVYGTMLARLTDAGVTPIAMTLPPIDAEKYLSHIGRTADGSRVLQWLGDAQMIYRFHELYSATAARLAREAGAWLLDVRASFLADHRFSHLIGEDGIHLSAEGYGRLADILSGLVAGRRRAMAAGQA